ncbi:universal stress protein [Solihabitans fulvus]|uniref:Universal stress protein n=2 Tax=Solihabitans fulvus TaxID=1892852 RepID=A0A5B2WLT4_9PSEU|nr:universal stress protein [Solihabitans fulvus]
MRRIVVGVDGGPNSLQALRRAVEEARSRGALVESVLAWTAPGGELVDRRSPSPHLRQLWTADAQERLRTAWDEALGGPPADLAVRLTVARGPAGWVLVAIADREDDLLVVGSGCRGLLRRALHTSVSRYCVARAGCPVLAVPPSRLARQLRSPRVVVPSTP